MVKESVDLLGLMRKRAEDGDFDFLREGLRVLTQGIMDAEVTAPIYRGGVWGANTGQADASERLSRTALGYTRWHGGPADPQAAGGALLPQPA